MGIYYFIFYQYEASFWGIYPEESVLFKTNFDYCFTPSSRSFRFAIRKTSIHFFGATSDWVRVAHTASYAKSKKSPRNEG